MERLFPVLFQCWKEHEKWPETWVLILHIITVYDFKALPFLLHRYQTPQFKNITIPAIAFLLNNSRILATY